MNICFSGLLQPEKQIELFGQINFSTFLLAEKQIRRFVTKWLKNGIWNVEYLIGTCDVIQT